MRILKLSAIALAVIGAVAGGAVLAQEGHHHGGFMRHHIDARINAALDAAKVSAEQRSTIEKARDKAFAAFEQQGDHQQHLQKVLALFEADKIDAAQVKALRDEHDAKARAMGDAIVAAINEAHATLQPAQRKALVENLRAHKPEGPPKAVADWFKKRAFSHVSDGLDEVKATEQQRVAVDNAIEQVWTAFRAEHEAGPAHLDAALKLFEADRIDAKQLSALRAENEARREKISEAVVQAFHDVHDVLTAPQRKQLVAWVRANHSHM